MHSQSFWLMGETKSGKRKTVDNGTLQHGGSWQQTLIAFIAAPHLRNCYSPIAFYLIILPPHLIIANPVNVSLFLLWTFKTFV